LQSNFVLLLLCSKDC